MATETLYASSVTSAGVLLNGSNAVGAADGTFTTNTGTTNWTAKFAIGNPAGNTPNGSHTVTARVRKIAGQTGTPVLNSISLYEGATLIATRTLSANVTSTTGQDVVATFTETELRSVVDLTALEIEVVTTAAGGATGVRTPIQLDALTWSGDFTTVAPATNLVVQSATHTHTSDSPTITTVNPPVSLVVQDATHAHSASQPTIVAIPAPVDLVVQGAIHGHVASSPTLTSAGPAINLVVQGTVHSQSASQPTLTATLPAVNLVVQNALHAQSAESVSIEEVVLSIWPPGPNQIFPPGHYPPTKFYHKHGQQPKEATKWSEHYQLLWDGYVPS